MIYIGQLNWMDGVKRLSPLGSFVFLDIFNFLWDFVILAAVAGATVCCFYD